MGGRVVGGADSGAAPWAVAVMSGFERKGRWVVPRRMNCVAFWGGGELDLRQADFSAGEVEINCVAVMGGIQITVPPGVEVVVRGIGIMGGFDHREAGVPGDPGAPRVIVTGVAFWGGVGIERKKLRASKAERRREREARRGLRDDAHGAVHGAHRRMLEDHRDLVREQRREAREEYREERRDRRDRRRYGE